jgi:hypothetical protein
MGEWSYISTVTNRGTGWRRVVSFTPRPLYPREHDPSVVEAGWAPEPVWMLWRSEKSCYRESNCYFSAVLLVA